MKPLSGQAFERARTFMRTQARALDARRFEHAFEGGAAEAVVDALAAYRNDDGGFGRALEPDCRYDGSWPVATTVALACLHEVGVPADAPLVRGAVDYLLTAFDADNQLWPFSLPGMNAVPHAPWWHYGDKPASQDEFALVNPLFAAVGCLHAYAPGVPKTFLRDVTAVAMARLDAQPDAMEKHVFRDALFMQQHLPESERAVAVQKLRRAAPVIVERDPAQWSTYCAGPLWCAPTPEAPTADLVRADLDAHLDFEIERQAADGSWKPPWTWLGNEEQYPDAWAQAEREWAGQLTLDMLRTLRAHGCIAGV